jgi:predicted transcriptional regulator
MRLGTVRENSQDMMARERHGLPKTVVRAILTLLDRGTTQQDIADLYGISREAVSAIATGRSHQTVDRGEAARQTSITDQPTQEINEEQT